MTVDEFKKMKPDLAHLEGNDLLNAMEDYMLTLNSGQEVMKSAMPFFKRYQLRWLFYRRLPNMKWGKNDYSSEERCSSCKKGVGGLKMGCLMNGKYYSFCPHCSKELIEEKNTNLNHKVWVVYSVIIKFFWALLDRIHLVRSSHSGRYDMFGDEAKYVQYWGYDMESCEVKFYFKKRKWWEYIFIERKTFKF